jgi:hypothetical protein
LQVKPICVSCVESENAKAEFEIFVSLQTM